MVTSSTEDKRPLAKKAAKYALAASAGVAVVYGLFILAFLLAPGGEEWFFGITAIGMWVYPVAIHVLYVAVPVLIVAVISLIFS